MDSVRELFVGQDGHRWPFSKGLVVESLLNAGVTPEAGAAVARSVEQHLLDADRRLVSPAELKEEMVRFTRELVGDEAAARAAAQTPAFEDMPVAGGSGRVPFSRGVLARSLEDVGLSARDAYRVASRVDAALRARGLRELTPDDIETAAGNILRETLGEEWAQTYRFLRHNRGRLGVVDGAGLTTPFSKGILSQSLLAAGLSPQYARRVARETQQRLRGKGARTVVTHDVLMGTVAEILRRELGDLTATRYRLLRTVRRPPRPIVVLLGGVSGTGKSVLASEVAYRLGIARIVSTDSVRQVMRAMVGPQLLPTLHASTFNAWEALLDPAEKRPKKPSHKQLLAGFREQVAQVGVGLRAIITRSIEEGASVMVEGVHAAPGFLMAEPFPGAVVVPMLVTVPDEAEHRSHFEHRDREVGFYRPASRYLNSFREIRVLHDYLLDLAGKTGVPTLHARSLEGAADQAVDLVLQRVLSELEREEAASGEAASSPATTSSTRASS